MSLSDHEKDSLRQMEEHFRKHDPKLVSKLSGDYEKNGSFSIRKMFFGIMLAILGLIILFISIYQKAIFVGVIGFICMFGGIVLASTSKINGEKSVSSKNRQHEKDGSFMHKLEKRWDDRKKD